MNEKMVQIMKEWIQKEGQRIEQECFNFEWRPSLKFRVKMRWLFLKARMKERFFKLKGSRNNSVMQ